MKEAKLTAELKMGWSPPGPPWPPNPAPFGKVLDFGQGGNAGR
jgi:hypothetical protein